MTIIMKGDDDGATYTCLCVCLCACVLRSSLCFIILLLFLALQAQISSLRAELRSSQEETADLVRQVSLKARSKDAV